MQLKDKKITVGEALAVATSTLLAQTPGQALAESKEFTFDASYLDYREDERVKVREVDLSFDWQMNDDHKVGGKLITDSITGATPSGALKPPNTGSQTLTSPSGVQGASGTGAQSGTFLDPLETIVDRRVGVVASYSTNHSREFASNLGVNFSNEDDYQSYGVSAGIVYEMNNKLTTLDASLAWSYDTVSPEGGPPQELGNVEDSRPDAFNDGEKTIFDRNLGLTQVINRRTVMKLGFSNGNIDGYLSDPYKVVTLVEPVVDTTTGTQSDQISGYFHEKRPNSRRRNAIVFSLNHQPGDEDVIGFKYRYFWDDWDIKAHEVDLHYLFEMSGDWYIQPHVRYYTQTAASFYVPYLDTAEGQDPEFGSNPPKYASADYRLDELNTVTTGLKVGVRTQLGHVRFRYETITQEGTEGDFTELKATIIHAMWTMKF